MNADAIRRYKELADTNTEAVRRMREHDRSLVEDLNRQVIDAERRLALATERDRVARMGVRLHWEAAVEELWNERWLPVPPLRPADDVPAGLDLTAADTEVGRTYEILRDALRKPGLLPKRRQG
ncbi:MAG TPA: hypothetical protein VG317_07305 [Pseudonocardiaceae bacterium]|jgi:hypothetical protein|nr:hypothetical protein [Pseudonocardiaceae bacterium]